MVEKTKETFERNLRKDVSGNPRIVNEIGLIKSFRDIPIVPTAADIYSTDKPFIRKNKVQGKFNDGEHYLDVQFRLLREDLVQPLREGILEIINEIPKPEKKQALKLYYQIKMKYPQCTKSGLIYRISFDTISTKKIPWKHSRRLIYGNLLCFSKDQFRTIVFAIVANRDPELLSRGLLDIRLVNSDDAKYFKTNQEIQMVESNTYFEAYRYVLKSMKSFTSKSIPMSKYLVDCDTNVNAPAYLNERNASKYDLRDSLNISEKVSSQINILDDKKWPTYEETALNYSQLNAFKHALTKEFVVIHGPPGTGKTHLGLRIAHALLKNMPLKEPLLIVCYTNHALDQFLKGLIDLGHKNLIRLGNRCCEELKQFSIQNKTKRIMEAAHLRRITSIYYNESNEKLNKLQQVIKLIRKIKSKPYTERLLLMKKIEQCFEKARVVEKYINKGKFIGIETLQPFMLKEHKQCLHKYSARCTELNLHVFDIFLQLIGIQPDEVFNIFDSENSQENAASETDSDEDQTIEITGEGDALADLWVTDDNQFQLPKTEKNEGIEAKDQQKTYIDSQGFQYQKPTNTKRMKAFRTFYHKFEAMSAEEAKDVGNPWQLSLEERWRLYKFWVEEYSKADASQATLEIQHYEDACLKISELEKKENTVVMKNVDIIAMTTSSAARLQDVLEQIKPKIVIVEEVAEVLEGHVLTSLPSSVQHLILIGDHFQLRPNPSVYHLAKSFGLDVSLFERMINNGIQYHKLDVQHRMRPEISRYLHNIYPSLKDHHTVYDYPNVKGVIRNVMFINHCETESNIEIMKSKSNLHEATFLVALCRYFLQQGYKPNQITILAGYSGQIIQLKQLMPKKLYEGVRVAAIDNFQGEENDIILLSLVRSNDDDKIGFLRIENRICVALSRAKQGLYVTGNFDLMKGKSSLWQKVIQDAETNEHFSDTLTLCCQNHPKTFIQVKEAADFKQAPEGGCLRPCSYILDCGHICERVCHPNDIEHLEYVCKKKCRRETCDIGHTCTKRCHFGTDCGKCTTLVSKTIPDCNHSQLTECHQDPANAKCINDCEKILACGHKCQRKCCQICIRYSCLEFVNKKLPCGHIKDVPCYQDVKEAKCNAKCNQKLDCGHKCLGSCTECNMGKLHVSCEAKCKKTLICGHVCKAYCSEDCPACKEKCENHCPHGACGKECGISCSQCVKDCLWRCQHKVCGRKCYEECDRLPCNEPCNLQLACGHLCIGLCGELCPSKCRICDRKEVERMCFGIKEANDARFIQLEDCSHIFEVSRLDQWMETQIEGENSDLKFKECPKCRTVIRRSFRYGNVIKRILRDVENKKKKNRTAD